MGALVTTVQTQILVITNAAVYRWAISLSVMILAVD